jgi:integrase
MAQKIEFKKTTLKNITAPTTGRAYYQDITIPGLVLQVTTAGTKSFQVYRKVGKKPVRVTLGKFPAMAVETARKEALKHLSEMVIGVNPNSRKKDDEKTNITLRRVFTDYLTARKALKPGTVRDYTRLLKVEAFPDWLDLPLKNITRAEVEKRHAELGTRSEARANNAMRVLRALFNYAIGQYENSQGEALFSDNPVKRISHAKSWYRVERRTTVVKVSELKTWLHAVRALTSQDGAQAETVRDYLQLLLFTGLRREEAARLEWADIDFKERTLLVRDTKNRVPLVLPLAGYTFDLLSRRKQVAVNQFVFGNLKTRSGRIEDPKKLIYRLREQTGVFFNPHDLRRTFATIVERLDIPAYALKRLLNHKMNGDVTAGYVVMDVERLRKPVQQVADFILKEAGLMESAEVVALKQQNMS